MTTTNPRPVSWRTLHDKHDRACAKIATIARNNTVFGGCSALVLAKRLQRMRSTLPAMQIVGDVYGASTGEASIEWEAWECPECGCAHLGRDAAYDCCGECLD